jgi:hypothetical protein
MPLTEADAHLFHVEHSRPDPRHEAARSRFPVLGGVSRLDATATSCKE